MNERLRKLPFIQVEIGHATTEGRLFPAPRLGSLTAWAVVLYQGVLGAVAHVWWYRAVEVVGPSRSAIFLNLQPLVGIVLAATLLWEPIGIWQILGTACILAGVALTTRARREP